MRCQRAYSPVFEDWLFHILLLMIAYAGLLASALSTFHHLRGALFGIAGACLLLLVFGIHNSWNNFTYLVLLRSKHAHAARRSSSQDALSRLTHRQFFEAVAVLIHCCPQAFIGRLQYRAVEGANGLEAVPKGFYIGRSWQIGYVAHESMTHR